MMLENVQWWVLHMASMHWWRSEIELSKTKPHFWNENNPRAGVRPRKQKAKNEDTPAPNLATIWRIREWESNDAQLKDQQSQYTQRGRKISAPSNTFCFAKRDLHFPLFFVWVWFIIVGHKNPQKKPQMLLSSAKKGAFCFFFGSMCVMLFFAPLLLFGGHMWIDKVWNFMHALGQFVGNRYLFFWLNPHGVGVTIKTQEKVPRHMETWRIFMNC